MGTTAQITKLNETELKNNVPFSASWHQEYSDTAYIFIGNLPKVLTEKDILAIFSQYGVPTDIRIPRDRETAEPRGFGFLKYEDQRSAVLAVDNFNGIKLLDRIIRVDHCYYKAQFDERGNEIVTDFDRTTQRELEKDFITYEEETKQIEGRESFESDKNHEIRHNDRIYHGRDKHDGGVRSSRHSRHRDERIGSDNKSQSRQRDYHGSGRDRHRHRDRHREYRDRSRHGEERDRERLQYDKDRKDEKYDKDNRKDKEERYRETNRKNDGNRQRSRDKTLEEHTSAAGKVERDSDEHKEPRTISVALDNRAKQDQERNDKGNINDDANFNANNQYQGDLAW